MCTVVKKSFEQYVQVEVRLSAVGH